MQQDVFIQLRDLVCERLDVPREDFTEGASFIEDLGADSLDIVDLAMCIEESTGLTIPDGDYVHFATVGDAVAYITARKSQQTPAAEEVQTSSSPA